MTDRSACDTPPNLPVTAPDTGATAAQLVQNPSRLGIMP